MNGNLFDCLFEEPQGYAKPTEEAHYQTIAVEIENKIHTWHIRLPGEHSLWAHKLWNSGLVLAEELGREELNYGPGGSACELFVEFGAGAALPSLVLANRGCVCIATDYPEAPLLENIALNVAACLPASAKGRVEVEGYLWGANSGAVIAHGGQADCAVLSDLICNHHAHRALLSSCLACVKPGGSVLVSYTHHRPHLAAEDLDFFEAARAPTFGFTEDVAWARKVLVDAPMFPDDPGDVDIRRTVHMRRLVVPE